MLTSELPALHTTGTFPELAVYNHGLRMDAVIQALCRQNVRSVIDLGCGDGALAKSILRSDLLLDRYIGIDFWKDRLQIAKSDPELQTELVSFHEGSMTGLEEIIDDPESFRHLGSVILLETIEHVPRDMVGHIEAGVFSHIAPQLVVVTTPDATKRLNEEQLQARGHHFEWDVAEFRNWASETAAQYPDYLVNISQLTGPSFVRNTQIATFIRT